MDELRFIVNELNKHFDTDYNMISFDSLPETELLQVLLNVLNMVNATTKVEVHKNKEQAIMNILNALQSIKYVPEKDISSTDFREGLIIGRRNIVHPILYWVLSNVEKVKRRVYFATFVEKTEIPNELLNEPDIEQMNMNYDKLIEEFWHSYNENGKEKKNAEESTELQEDTKKMSADMSYLLQRLEIQNDKLKNIPNREALINSVKSYRSEVKQKEKLQDQLRDHKNILIQMSSEIKSLQSTLNQNAGRRPENLDPIQQIREELQINKIFVDGQLPREHEDIVMELNAFERVAHESEPMQDEMDAFNTEMEELSQKVQTLLNKKIALTNTNDDQLLPFRNQATIIANKKQELSNFIMKVKTRNESVLEQINQKLMTLRELVGGDLLHGEDLKQFINNLRERSIVYKKCRSYLQGLQAAIGISTRTMEILRLEDPSIVEAISAEREKPIKDMEQDLQTDDVAELKYKCKTLYQEANAKKADSEHVYDELIKLRSDYGTYNDVFYETKREFDNATGNLSGEIEKYEQSFEQLDDDIKKDETEWKDIVKSIESYELIFQKYSADIDQDDVNVIEKLTDRLRANEKSNKDMLNQLEQAKQLKSVEQDEIEQLQRIKQMILFKLKQAAF